MAAGSRTRKELIEKVGMNLGRELGTVSIFFHQAIASKLGLNVTDTRCFELMSRYVRKSLTAGDLARATGLTTGAVTGILDRLENARLIQRYRDGSDRRKVFVRPRSEAFHRFGRFYEGLAASMLKLASSFSTRELQVICDYMEETLKVFRAQSSKLSKRPLADPLSAPEIHNPRTEQGRRRQTLVSS